MIESSTSKDRRAQLAATIGLLFQAVFFAVLLAVGIVYESDAVTAAARWMLGGVIIWPVIALIYSQRRRTAEEKLEAEELKRSHEAGEAQAIFDAEDEAYLIEKRRLDWMLRWLVPGAAVILAAYHIVGSFVWWPWELGTPLDDEVWRPTQHSGRAMAFVGGAGFLAFLFSRYTTGMARVPGWRMLRSGASYLAGNALCCLVVLIAISLQETDVPHPEALAAYAIRLALLVLGIEFIANFVLDFYRPRAVGQESRPAFDSRLLALITEPGGIARSLAEAINYQFGFEVSRTWFYQLLKRAMLPMIAFGLLSLFALSGVLIIDADEQAVVERFGKRLQVPGEALEPGPHLKAPWPIDIARRARVQQVRTLTVGDAPTEEAEEEVGGRQRKRPILWGEKHEFNAEMMLVVASPELTDFTDDRVEQEEQGKAVAVGLLMVSVDVQYCVGDIHGYLYKYVDPEKTVEAIAYQVLTDYAASVDVDQFLGPGRALVNEALREILQRRVDKLGLGIHVLFVALQEAHPTADVAKAFQEVVKAELEKDASIENARGIAEQLLTTQAGSRSRALLLDQAIIARDTLAQDPGASAEARAAAKKRVSDLLEGTLDKRIAPTGGRSAKQIAQARTRVQADITRAKRALALFSAELVAYQAAPRLYKVRKYLDMLQRSVERIRKYIIVAGPNKKIIIEFEKEEKGTIDLGEPER